MKSTHHENPLQSSKFSGNINNIIYMEWCCVLGNRLKSASHFDEIYCSLYFLISKGKQLRGNIK